MSPIRHQIPKDLAARLQLYRAGPSLAMSDSHKPLFQDCQRLTGITKPSSPFHRSLRLHSSSSITAIEPYPRLPHFSDMQLADLTYSDFAYALLKDNPQMKLERGTVEAAMTKFFQERKPTELAEEAQERLESKAEHFWYCMMEGEGRDGFGSGKA